MIIPTYNRASLVCRAITSALEQSLTASEVIVIDDGSTDNTVQIIADRFGDRVVLHSQENAGVAAARNAGIRLATSDLIAFLDSDDTWAHDKLAQQLPAMNHAGVVLSATNWRLEHEPEGNAFQEVGLVAGPDLAIETLPLTRLSAPQGHRILIPTCICRRDALVQLDGFDESLRITEDMDLIFRMATLGSFAILPELLFFRGGADELDHLTEVASTEWWRENLENHLAIFARSVEHARHYPPEDQQVVRTRFSRLLIDRALLASKSGELGAARQFALRSLRPAAVFSREFLMGIVGVTFPRLLKRRGKKVRFC